MRVNINKKIILSIIIILSITFISTVSKAAWEIKLNKNKYYKSPSEAYQICYELKNADSTLGINQVDPHLILNKDWAATLFLSLSTYGNAREMINNNIKINNIECVTSNGNYTGVMIVEGSYSSSHETASILETFNGTEANYTDLTNLVKNRNTKYVENIKLPITDKSNKGLGFIEAGSKFSLYEPYPNFSRRRNFTYECGSNSNSSTEFRPAIWNIDR